MENTSTSYLQQLLNSFPSMDASVDRKQDGESSDGEYQIYKQDNDENDLDNDYDD
jgi:general transcription factor 3C polypeptide 5 (transcription factor C subunit 1)